jgi:hypothetical protein
MYYLVFFFLRATYKILPFNRAVVSCNNDLRWYGLVCFPKVDNAISWEGHLGDLLQAPY